MGAILSRLRLSPIRSRQDGIRRTLTLQGPPLSDVEAAWSREIEERIAAYDRGDLQAFSAENVFAEARRNTR